MSDHTKRVRISGARTRTLPKFDAAAGNLVEIDLGDTDDIENHKLNALLLTYADKIRLVIAADADAARTAFDVTDDDAEYLTLFGAVYNLSLPLVGETGKLYICRADTSVSVDIDQGLSYAFVSWPVY